MEIIDNYLKKRISNICENCKYEGTGSTFDYTYTHYCNFPRNIKRNKSLKDIDCDYFKPIRSLLWMYVWVSVFMIEMIFLFVVGLTTHQPALSWIAIILSLIIFSFGYMIIRDNRHDR